jgi:cell division transport system permease protein
MRPVSLRPSGFDELGLRRALSDRLLPFLVAAMGFLAALALAGWVGAASLARNWQAGGGSALTVQVPHPTEPAKSGDGTRVARVLSVLTGTPGVGSARQLSQDELASLLRPWLGAPVATTGLPLPAVISVRLSDSDADLAPLTGRLEADVPGVLIEGHGLWISRLTKLARSLQACAGLALLLVVGVATAVVAVATRSGLSARREAIEIVHGLGATDSYIAGRFSARVTLLASAGGLAGAILALPVLMTLASLATPFTAGGTAAGVAPPAFASSTQFLSALPAAIWVSLIALPIGAAIIGFLTAQGTVRRWLRRMP